MENDNKTVIYRQLDQLDSRLERIEDKLDNHLGRVSQLEARVESLKGSIRVGVAIFLSAIGFLGTALWNLLFPHK